MAGRYPFVNDDYAVSTGSGSDRVSIHVTVEFVRTITRTLPLPVLTSSLNSILEGTERPSCTKDNLSDSASVKKH